MALLLDDPIREQQVWQDYMPWGLEDEDYAYLALHLLDQLALTDTQLAQVRQWAQDALLQTEVEAERHAKRLCPVRDTDRCPPITPVPARLETTDTGTG